MGGRDAGAHRPVQCIPIRTLAVVATDGRRAPELAGKPRRVSVAAGPRYGTVGPDYIKEAAKEAVRGIGFWELAQNGATAAPPYPASSYLFGGVNTRTFALRSPGRVRLRLRPA